MAGGVTSHPNASTAHLSFFFRNDPASLAEAIAGDVYMRRETITMLIHGIPRITSPSADG
jgi:hypothetical protein